MGANIRFKNMWGRRVAREIEVCGVIQPKYDGAENNTFRNYFSLEIRGRWCAHWKIGLKTFEYQIENPKVNTAAVPVCLYSNAIPVIYELDLESEKSETKCIRFDPIQYFSLQKNGGRVKVDFFKVDTRF